METEENKEKEEQSKQTKIALQEDIESFFESRVPISSKTKLQPNIQFLREEDIKNGEYITVIDTGIDRTQRQKGVPVMIIKWGNKKKLEDMVFYFYEAPDEIKEGSTFRKKNDDFEEVDDISVPKIMQYIGFEDVKSKEEAKQKMVLFTHTDNKVVGDLLDKTLKRMVLSGTKKNAKDLLGIGGVSKTLDKRDDLIKTHFNDLRSMYFALETFDNLKIDITMLSIVPFMIKYYERNKEMTEKRIPEAKKKYGIVSSKVVTAITPKKVQKIVQKPKTISAKIKSIFPKDTLKF